MFQDKTVAVVIPAYNEEHLIGRVIETMPDFVDKMVVVDDRSSDDTRAIVEEYCAADPDRVVLVALEENSGVGGAISAGYKWARDNEIDCTAVMAGDAQMDPNDLPALLEPVASGRADYAKGNRLFFGDAWNMIPRIRYLGNSGLSLMTKVASGYWHVADSQTGYTVASLEVLKTIDLDSIYPRYGMPNDMLVRLNVYDFRIADLPIRPVYNVGEKSGISIAKVLFTIPMLLIRLFTYRMVHKYVIRDFHPLILFYVLGVTLFALDIPLGIRLIYKTFANGQVPSITALAILFCTILGFQSLLFAMLFDMEANRELNARPPRRRADEIRSQ